MQAITKKVAVIVKIDPISEQLERGPDGLCVKVTPTASRLMEGW
jgi:hypothetical protein